MGLPEDNTSALLIIQYVKERHGTPFYSFFFLLGGLKGVGIGCGTEIYQEKVN